MRQRGGGEKPGHNGVPFWLTSAFLLTFDGSDHKEKLFY
jgi:hypothetical protein